MARHDDTRASGDGGENATDRLRRAIQGAANGTIPQDELKAASAALVSELRAANEAPEQMLLRIKRILSDAGLRPSYATPPGTDGPTTRQDTAVYRDVIAYAIQHYYENGPGPRES